MSLRALAAFIAVLGLSIPAMTGNTAGAADYPAKPIKLVDAFAPGGPADVVARLIAAGISPGLGKAVYVENRPGAGGTIGARDVAASAPDGYTLLLGNTANLVISPLLYREAGYDPAKAFAAVALVGTTPNILIASKASGLKSVQEVIAYAPEKSGQAELFFRRNWHPPASDRRNVQATPRAGYRAYPLQERWPGHTGGHEG